MAFKDFPAQAQGVTLLQRSLARGRLGHAYLFTGDQLEVLESLAATLARTLNCQRSITADTVPIDCCDQCAACRRIGQGVHPDVHWVRPESKSRVIVIEQMRGLMQEVNLKPKEAEYKVAIIVAADRLNESAANAFLKTLEEPPARSVLILLTTEPQRLLETILSRCLRLNFFGEGAVAGGVAEAEWLAQFSELAAAEQKSLLSRYRLLDVLLRRLSEIKSAVEAALTQRSPLERYREVEPALREKWEEELKAAVEAEYRRRRAEVLLSVQWWLRDVWLRTLSVGESLLSFPQLPGADSVAARVTARQAGENLRVLEHTQRLLHTNVQESLALEVGLLKLQL